MKIEETVTFPKAETIAVKHIDIFPNNVSTKYHGYEVPNYYHVDHALIDPLTLKSHTGGRQAPLLLSAADMKFIRAIQPLDAFPVDKKMNWIGEGKTEDDGRPCWMKGDGSYKCDSMVFGCASFGYAWIPPLTRYSTSGTT